MERVLRRDFEMAIMCRPGRLPSTVVSVASGYCVPLGCTSLVASSFVVQVISNDPFFELVTREATPLIIGAIVSVLPLAGLSAASASSAAFANGTASRYNMGALPAAGQWVQLEVSASFVGPEGSAIKGMCFSCSGGHATWDAAGKASPTN